MAEDGADDNDQLLDPSRWDLGGGSSSSLVCESCGSENVHLNAIDIHIRSIRII